MLGLFGGGGLFGYALGTLGSQNANNVAITGGNIDGTTIGATTPSSARVYTPSATTFSGTTGTLALADAERFQICTNASTQALAVPPNSSVAFPVDSEISFVQDGAGQLTFAAGAGVTINSVNSYLKIIGRYGVACLKKTATNTWYLFGAITG